MNAQQILVEALNSTQRACMEARDTLRAAENAVRYATQALAESEAAAEFIAQVLRHTPTTPEGEN